MGGENTYTKLRSRVNRAVGKEVKKMCFKLLNRILQETFVELNADRINDVEQRRILWTSYNNMNMWFENWERDLEELGFTVLIPYFWGPTKGTHFGF